MRVFKLVMWDRSNFYVRRASEDGSCIEIQNQYSGIIVKNPRIRRTIRYGVILEDWSIAGPSRWCGNFTDRNSIGFERNMYTREHYNQ